jgi:uncharacterized protein
MPYGLRHSDLEHIVNAITQFDEISEVVLFGSRAKGNYQPGSDIDLAIKGERITHATVNHLSECLNEEKPLPYFFDVVHYETLNNIPLREHIDRVGIVIFQASKATTDYASTPVSKFF